MVRGGIVNRATDEIIAEINNLILSGYKEVVLTGVHIGRYKYDRLPSLTGLIEDILIKTALARLRLSSIEPQEITSDLGKIMYDGKERICRHLHVPLQSGSDRILESMRRPYTIKKYLETIRMMKEKIDGLVVGADLIVGFPGETEADFGESVKAASSGLIDYLHVFSYSDRPGTAASRLPGKIHSSIIKKRNEILHRISAENHRLALAREIGHTVRAISEHRPEKGDSYFGITDNYLKIAIPENQGGGKEIIRLQVTDVIDDHLIGD